MKPLVIGVAGGSGSGKTTLARTLLKELGPERCVLIAQDSYYIDQSERFDQDGGAVNFDHPSSLEFSLLAQHLQTLRAGLAVQVPVYDFSTHRRLAKSERVEPKQFVVVDGILILSQKAVRDQLDLAIFVDAPERVRFDRRLARDVKERGRSPDGVQRQFQLQVKPMHDQFVEPSRVYAHLLISGTQDVQQSVRDVQAAIKKGFQSVKS